MARFRVARAFVADSRFVFEGEVVEGEIVPGMLISVSLNSSLALTEPIQAVEIIGSGVALSISCSDDMDRAIWEGLGVADEVVEVGPASGDGAA